LTYGVADEEHEGTDISLDQVPDNLKRRVREAKKIEGLFNLGDAATQENHEETEE